MSRSPFRILFLVVCGAGNTTGVELVDLQRAVTKDARTATPAPPKGADKIAGPFSLPVPFYLDEKGNRKMKMHTSTAKVVTFWLFILTLLVVRGRADVFADSFTNTDRSRIAAARETYGKLPLSFEANRGQTAPSAQFLAHGVGYSLFLTGNGAVFIMSRRDKQAINSALSRATTKTTVLRMNLVGANSVSAAEGLDEQAGKANYFIGNDSAKWQVNIPTFGRVQYKNVYSGIDLTYYGNQRQLEYDFIVAPKADYKQIELDFKGAKKVEIERASGDLLLHTRLGVMREHQPKVYQEVNGARQEIPGWYVMRGHGRVGFEVGEYDTSAPLIIDPVLVYSTYLGGSGADQGNGIAVDSSGNAYVIGTTTSTNFPTANAIQGTFGGGSFGDAFVTKLNAAGTALVYSTYLGGSSLDQGNGIAVDSSGNAYLTGLTSSTNFPTVNPVQSANGGTSDAFIAKINSAGSAIVYSTYLGGGNSDDGVGIAVDSSGNAYVAGETQSTNFPTVNPFQSAYGGGRDGFVTKINAAGSAYVYSTYLGGSSDDAIKSIALDSAGNAYVAGATASTNFPTATPIQPANAAAGGYNCFVTKINAAGSALVYSTYLGGSGGFDVATGIAVDSSGDAYITGVTVSTDFPTANAFQGTHATDSGVNDAFVTKIRDASQLLNISTRMRVLTGDQVLIGGFIVTGTDPKRVIIRGIGPSLNGVGVTLSDPTLELHQGTTVIKNDNWKINDQTGQSQEAEIRATTIPPTNDLESAIIATLPPGNYTAILAGKNGGTGVGLVEIYDLAQGANSTLANISSRGFVDTGDNVMIGGLIVGGGSGGGVTRVIVRANGPSLNVNGTSVPGRLADPTLELHNASGTMIVTNDNWKINDQTGQSQEADIRATTVPPTNDLESAIVATLPPDNYTAIVRGKNNTVGIAVVEAYNLQ